MKAVVFPKSGLITEQGTLLQWTASEGDRVEEGQLLCEVETEKTTIEVTAPVSGPPSEDTCRRGRQGGPWV